MWAILYPFILRLIIWILPEIILVGIISRLEDLLFDEYVVEIAPDWRWIFMAC
jgi:hypothetical protein